MADPMQFQTFREVVRGAVKGLDRAGGLLLLCAVCMPVIYWYQGRPFFFKEHFASPGGAGIEVHAQLWRFLAAFLLFFALPALGYRLLGGKSLGDLGLRLGDWRMGLKLALIALAVTTPALWISAADPAMQRTYPLAPEAAGDPSIFAMYEASYALYYWGWEFFFRGALQLGLTPALGFTGAMMTQWLPSVLIHFDKPLMETWGAVLVGPLFGVAAARTRSFLYIFLFHYGIGVINDIFCAMRQGLL